MQNSSFSASLGKTRTPGNFGPAASRAAVGWAAVGWPAVGCPVSGRLPLGLPSPRPRPGWVWAFSQRLAHSVVCLKEESETFPFLMSLPKRGKQKLG